MYSFYQKFILRYPLLILSLLLIVILSFSFYATKLEIDASAETLLLDDDKDLAFSRTMDKRFTTDNILILTYRPYQDLLSDESLKTLKELSHDLESLPHVESVQSLLNLPLLFSPTQEFSALVDNIRTLENSTPDRSLVKQEFLTSPLYKDSLVSKDFKTTAIVIHLYADSKYDTLLEKRNFLLKKQREQTLTEEEKIELQHTLAAFKEHRDKQRRIEHKNINDIRKVMSKYKDKAVLFLGGVQMIANDIVTFVENDLVVYGSTLILLLILVLGMVFKQVRWITIPILICLLSVIAITSSLGFFAWEITVISSNFIALQLIITISIVLHLIVRYEELLRKYPRASHQRVVLFTILSKAKATFFAILTTIAGFSALVFSHIYPVVNLGWMMSAGVAMSLLITFIVFPTILVLLKKKKPKKRKEPGFSLPKLSSHIVLNDKKAIFFVTALLLAFSVSGASKLIVENSFINYFKQDTDIYKGMKVIDEELGGTTPLDIILSFKEETPLSSTPNGDTLEEDNFEDEFSAIEEEDQYWFTDEKMALIHRIQSYLESIEEIGEVKSFATLLETGKRLNHNQELDSVKLALLYQKLPEKYRGVVLSPYINIEHNQARFATRIIDSNENLRRNQLLETIRRDLGQMINPEVASFRLSNLMVLYNNMLQSLFDSQIATLGFVLFILFVMFMILFRSLLLTFIALIVNIIPIGVIFGFMGWFNIPLNIMTITIAAIAMGIGVDDTIHYVQRFRKEYKKQKEYRQVIHTTNTNTGKAMYYTSLTVIIGFSILTLSNLIPTIYFGLLTMLTMFIALLSNLILLPRLILVLKPFDESRYYPTK